MQGPMMFSGVCFSYPAEKPVRVLEDVTFSLPPGRSMLVEGKNGSGKSTLLKLAAGKLRPDSGEVIPGGRPFFIGEDIDCQFFFSTVNEEIENICRGGEEDADSSSLAFHLGIEDFKGRACFELSYTEKARVLLYLACRSGRGIIFLDCLPEDERLLEAISFIVGKSLVSLVILSPQGRNFPEIKGLGRRYILEEGRLKELCA